MGPPWSKRRRALRYKSPQSCYHRRDVAEPSLRLTIKVLTPGGGSAVLRCSSRERPNRMRQINLWGLRDWPLGGGGGVP